MAIALMLRHGHSTANAAGVLAGWTEGVGLTETGWSQARAVGEALGALSLARVVSSPLQRCLETASGLGEITLDEELGECRYGAWTGRPLGELPGEPLWDAVQRDPASVTFPTGGPYAAESIAAMAERVWAAVRRHDEQVEATAGPQAVWVAVSHGDPIKAVLAQASGGGVGALQRFHVDPASVSVIRFTAHGPVVVASNGTAGQIADLLDRSAAVTSGAVVGGGTGHPAP